MAVLDTYDDLVNRIADWLFGRTDLQTQVPTFVRLFEAKANRTLFCRQMETRATAPVDLSSSEPEFLQLPTSFQTMRRVRLLNGASPQKPRLRFATGQQMDDEREKFPSPGQPIWFSIFGNEMEICPTPNSAYTLEMVYRIYLTPLGPPPAVVQINPLDAATVETNWLFALAPDAYLYGTLMEIAPYLHDDERIPVWASGAQAAIAQLNTLSEQATYNAGPLTMRRKGSGYS